eukprot:CAMPEP_0174371546 /NCGR_PEP_ID=MMETSP0811_2-20130205/100143_1 /TAXON_ID=73025 ORGANISM="Eutreptiella gymnastica-like, Strain CCMP1594" /NCGR_SAMPLE_ID=MMETSP0811_2 /ASSEMBLY_ACC=CAM_ASM_000667 /LENGTH=94 /DNA_ID=CAMNT_0015518009 /DNA_START=384 /DNA_END=665 /DNA_ORIENTATION=-
MTALPLSSFCPKSKNPAFNRHPNPTLSTHGAEVMLTVGGAPCAFPPLEQWAQQWSRRKMLLFMQHRLRPEAWQPPEVWRVFCDLHLPWWDRGFV